MILLNFFFSSNHTIAIHIKFMTSQDWTAVPIADPVEDIVLDSVEIPIADPVTVS